MEKRKHPRIQLPLLVELQHPSIGRRNCVARDISEGGVFVQFDEPTLKVGAKVRLTLKSTNTVDTQPTPTVEMEVVRLAEDGLGCRFVNRTSRHLWESAVRIRDELAVGRDYFQLHVCGACLNSSGRLLIVQQNGRWTFPGTYLVVGDDWRTTLTRTLTDRFSLEVSAESMQILSLETESSPELPEAAVAKVYAVLPVDDGRFAFQAGERYKASRWLPNPRMVDELTFTDEKTRTLAGAAFRWYRDRAGR